MSDLGFTGIGGTNYGASNLMGCKYTASEAGTATAIHFYWFGAASGHVKLAIYSDNAGVPNALLAQTGEINVEASAAWREAALISTIALVNGTTYWICIIMDHSSGSYYFDAGVTSQRFYTSGFSWANYASGFPATIPATCAYSDRKVSCHIVYTPGGSCRNQL